MKIVNIITLALGYFITADFAQLQGAAISSIIHMSSVHNGFQLWTLDFFMLKSLFSFLGYVSEQVRLLLFVLPWQSCYAVRYCTATPFLVSAVWFRFLSPPEISIYPTNR